MLNKIQQTQITDALSQLGLSDKETLVYLSILQNADSSIISIAKDTQLSRGTAYDLVERLKKKGYLAEVKRGKKRRIVVESPTNTLYSLLDAQHDRLSRSKQAVEEILPLIKTIVAESDFKPQIRVYTGEDGFRKVWNEILNFGGTDFLSIARIETFVKFVGEEFLWEIQKRKIKAGISSRAINESSELALKMQSADKQYDRETRLAPKGFEFPSSEIIFGDKLAMFSTREENIIVVIESKDFAQTHRIYFEMMWKFLEHQV
ncbi:MAG: helix-turn-helix domain-containing protein [Patescibacteria group bacterium]